MAQNPAWSLPPFFRVQIAPVSPLPTTNDYNGSPAIAASNMQMDSKENILFFVVVDMVYNKDRYEIGQLKWENVNTVTGALEIAIMPDPGNCSRYYIFTSSMTRLGTGNDYPYYAIVDMSTGMLMGDLSGFTNTDFVSNNVII